MVRAQKRKKTVVTGVEGETMGQGIFRASGDFSPARIEDWGFSGVASRGWRHGRIRERVKTYISGSFWVSITAATGIPKFDTGPQKSASTVISSELVSHFFCRHRRGKPPVSWSPIPRKKEKKEGDGRARSFFLWECPPAFSRLRGLLGRTYGWSTGSPAPCLIGFWH